MFTPLAGKRVVDLTHVLAGPYVTHILRQLGAEVVKIERPGTGDVMRAGRPELKDDPRFALAGNKGGFFVVADLEGARNAFAAGLLTGTTEHWESAFNDAGIAAQPGYDRPVETPGAGFRVDGVAAGANVPAPGLGGDSRTVLAGLGLTSDEIVKLEHDKVIQST